MNNNSPDRRKRRREKCLKIILEAVKTEPRTGSYLLNILESKNIRASRSYVGAILSPSIKSGFIGRSYDDLGRVFYYQDKE